eukprot:scaffold9620_cov197-Amphora_coffeaeformis.AAC.5
MKKQTVFWGDGFWWPFGRTEKVVRYYRYLCTISLHTACTVRTAVERCAPTDTTMVPYHTRKSEGRHSFFLCHYKPPPPPPQASRNNQSVERSHPSIVAPRTSSDDSSLHLRAAFPTIVMGVSIIDTSRDSHDEDDDNIHTNDPFHDELESEIARMSQDTDAILDSIRKAAAPTQAKRSKRRSLHALLELQKRAQQQQQRGHDDDLGTTGTDTDDDDMTDDGSVPEEVRRQIQEELDSLDTKFNTDPDGVSEEIRHVSFEASFMSSPTTTTGTSTSGGGSTATSATNDSVLDFEEEEETVDQKVAAAPAPSSWLLEPQILVLPVVVVWTGVLLLIARTMQHGLLDENGLVVLPFAILLGSSSS